MNPWPLGLRVGILGGGQLARMLAHAAQQMGFEVHVLCPDAMEPAATVTRFHHQGSADSAADLVSFLKSVDVVTFESEFFDMSLVQEKAPPNLRIFPDPSVMRVLQDRRTQKDLLTQFKIPTAPFCRVNAFADLKKAEGLFENGFVLKKARGGYDGNGTFMARRKADIDRLNDNFPAPSIAESFIPFKRELAAIAICGDHDFFFLPLVESHQKDNRCDWVAGPIKHKKWPTLQKSLKKMLRTIEYRGVIAFELFDTGSELLVNEVAPRVHNSGHYSQTALSQSQFSLHWLAGLGLEIEEPVLLSSAFVMTNLVGESNEAFQILAPLSGELHWYGKTQNRPGRKMGHLNYVGRTRGSLLKKALSERKRIRK